MTERLDKGLVTVGLCDTRSRAQDAIKAGLVKVNGAAITKSSYAVHLETDQITMDSPEQSFASRAGWKLNGALDRFQIDLQDRIVMDVGASTGGFTDVCLQRHAKRVYALDVGHDQLLERLKKDPRVVNREGVNCRYLDASMFEERPDFACIDVSFISIKQILPSVLNVLGAKQEMVVLIKPQFEAGKAALNKHGVIRDVKYHRQVLSDMIQFVEAQGLFIHHLANSSITGRDGNREFVMHICNLPIHRVFDVFRIASEENET